MSDNSLDQYFEEIWKHLDEGVRKRKHGFHLGTIATAVDNHPEARVVVLRHADLATGTLGFHTDFRVSKVSAMQQNPLVSWVFYCPKLMMQVQLHGSATLHHRDQIATEMWDKALLLSKRCYLGDIAPGTLTELPESGLPPHLEDREPLEEEAIHGIENFCVVRTQIHQISMLHTIFTGYRRATWKRDDSKWVGSWQIP